MMRRTISSFAAIVLMFAVFAFLFIGTTFIQSAEARQLQAIPAEVQNYVEQEGRQLFIEAVSKDPRGYGYSSARDVQNVTIGEGFPVYLIDPQQLSLPTANTFQDVIRATDQWEFIVYSDQQAMSYLRVGKTAAGYQLESFGGDSSHVKTALQHLPSTTNNSNPYLLITDKSDKYIVKLGETKQELVAIASPNHDLQSFGVPSHEAMQSEPIIKALRQYKHLNEHSDQDGGANSLGAPTEGAANHSVLHLILISGTVALFFTLLVWIGMKVRARR